MSEIQSSKKGPWGQFAILTAAAAAVGCTGIFSQILAGQTQRYCPKGKIVSAVVDGKDRGTAALATATGENAAIANAGIVALGTGIGIFLNAFINKFMPGAGESESGSTLLKSTKSRMLMVILIAVGMIVIGSISISSEPATTPEEQAIQVQRQKQLGGIVLGFGIGLMIPALIKFLVEASISKIGGANPRETAPTLVAKMNRMGVAGGTVVLGLYTTIIGAWAWNNYNLCNKKAGGKIDGHFFATLNSISTIVAAILTVYCGVYMFFKLRCKTGQPSRSCEIADTMASWSKMKGAGAAAAGRAGAAASAAASRAGAAMKRKGKEKAAPPAAPAE